MTRFVLVAVWIWATVVVGRFSADHLADTSVPNTVGPRTSDDAFGRLRRERYLRHLPHRSGDQPQGHETLAGEEPAVAGGGPRVRELPRPREGARRRRRQGAHVEVCRDEAGGHQPDVPYLPQPRRPRRLGRQRARAAQPVLRDVSQRAQSEVAGAAAGAADGNEALRDLSPAAGVEDRTRGRAHAGARGQDVLQLVPQPARVDQNVKALKVGSSVAESWTSCHTEMRGPVLFEHAPVRENCATCHDPHGSSNDRMLVVRMPMLCQRCHIASKHPATLYDKDQITTNKSNRMFGRSCVNCHSTVHGSNHRPVSSSCGKRENVDALPRLHGLVAPDRTGVARRARAGDDAAGPDAGEAGDAGTASRDAAGRRAG